MKSFVGVVSHGHECFIEKNIGLYVGLKESGVAVYIQDNLGVSRLEKLCRDYGFVYQANKHPIGFGANNNALFSRAILEGDVSADGYFCILNPDVFFNAELLVEAISEADRLGAGITTINLCRDRELVLDDLNIKKFPSVVDFAIGFLTGKNPACYAKDRISTACFVDWASGAFLMVRSDLYQRLGGFDTRYFMYLEDVDLCRRAREVFRVPVCYMPQFRAFHYGRRANQRLFSRHFVWFVTSMVKYFSRFGLSRPKADSKGSV